MYVYVVFVRSTEVDWYDHNPLLYVKSLVIFQSDCDLKLLLDLEWGDKTVEKWLIQYKKKHIMKRNIAEVSNMSIDWIILQTKKMKN